MVNALWLCLIPIIWGLIARFALPMKVTWKEAGLQAGGIALLVVMIYGIMSWSNTADTQIINGYVTGKEKNWTFCSHSYPCNCRTECYGSGESQSCSTVCDTCYEHTNDWNWDVYTTVGTKTIDRIDRRGSDEPPRWTAVVMGEPAASASSYTNYIKAAPNSLFNMTLAEQEAKTKAALIPAYPKVYDYYRVKHTISVGASVPNLDVWDTLIDNELKQLGAKKQVNILMVFVKGQGREYVETLERAWVGGKKNDVIVVVGTDGIKIDWVEAFTFGKTSGNGMLAVQLRDNLQALGTTENAAEGVKVVTTAVTQHFNRKQMADYEYLKAEGGPTDKQIGWLIGIVLLLLAGTTYLLWKHDLFNEEGYDRFIGRHLRFR